MRLAACAVLIFGVAAPLTGCVGGHRSVDDASSAIDAWTRPQLSTAVSPANPASDSTLAEQAGVSTPVQPAPRETDESRGALRTLVEYALEHNASVRAAVADVRARLARIAQATALPDPVVRAIVRPEPIQTAAGDAYFTLGVSQKLPPPAKLDHSGKMAWAEANAAIERLNALRLELVADIEVAYYQLYLIDRSIELTEAYLSTLEDIENVLAAQYRVGKAEQQDVLRAQSELAKLRDDHGRLRRERSSTAAALNRLLDRTPAHEVPVTEHMTPRVLDLDSDALIKLAGEHNPELAALYHDVERDREAVELSGLAFWPDPTIGVEWTYLDPRGAFEPPVTTSASGPPVVNRKSEVGDDNWAIMLQFNVPLWRDRIKAGRREAAQRLESTLQERRDKTDAVRFRVFDAWVRVKSHRETLRLLETTLIPQASQTYEVSLTAYQAGRADFLDVIENWHRLLDFELMLHREVVGAERAFSELQRHVGLELDSMALPSDPTNEGSQP